MFKSTALPDGIADQLPKSDRKSRFVTGPDGLYVVAGQHGLYFLKADGPQESGMWYEVQYGSWDADSQILTVVWTSPEKPTVQVRTNEENPEKFMRVMVSRVDRALVVTRQKTTQSGAVLTATVRRRADDELFSTVMVQGYLPPEEEQVAIELENQVRDEVGLDAIA